MNKKKIIEIISIVAAVFGLLAAIFKFLEKIVIKKANDI